MTSTPLSAGREDAAPLAHGLFEAAARRRPGAVAAVVEGAPVSYGALDAEANRLARHLRALGVRTETRVALLLERGPALPAALLAVLKAGGAYVPVDPGYPAERVRLLLRDSGAALVLADRAAAARAEDAGLPVLVLDGEERPWEAGDASAPEGGAHPDALAYVIYTSGSTGTPKGVAVTHRSLASHNRAAAERFGLAEGDRVAQVTSFGFDISVEEIFPAWAAGAAVVFRPRGVPVFGAAFRAWLAEEAVTVLDLPTAFWHAWVDELAADAAPLSPALRLVVVGGEAPRPAALAAWRTVAPAVRWINTYGPTEATVTATLYEPGGAAEEGEIPIGRPLANARAYLVDPALAAVAAGAEGELAIGGAGVARGYLGRPALTAERFRPDPFAGAAGARLYRTGDRVRVRADGEIEFRGRLDDQVKVAGFRVEPGEVEAALARHPAVAAAAVLARPAEGAGTRLVAYAALRAGAAAEPPELRRWLGERLPAFLVPAAVVLLDALPLTAHGKVDRRALPAPPAPEPAPEDGGPADGTERAVAAAWAEVLGVRPAPGDDFWEMGGHSLLAMRVLSRLGRSTGVELPVRALFDAPTVPALARLVEAARPAAAAAPHPPLGRLPAGEPAPLSFSQARLWFLHQMEPESPFYNIPFAVRLRGELDVAALERALAAIVRRHEALRTVFRDTPAGPVQVVEPAPAEFPLSVADLRALPPEWRGGEARRLMADEAEHPFDLRRDRLLRALLVRHSPTEHLLVLNLHHAAGDGWSIGIVFRELGALYGAFRDGAASPLPEPPLQYADFAVWQRARMRGPVLEAQLRYWRERLAGAPGVLELPTDRPRPAVQSHRGAMLSFRVDAALTDRLREVARAHGATLFMALLAAFAALVQRLSGRDDVVVGSPVAGRVRPETEGLVGFFVNTMALRTDLGGDPGFAALLGRVRETTLDAYAHPELPFERVVEELQPERTLAHNPLFQVAFALQNVAMDPVELPGLVLSPEDVDSGTSKFDLFLEMVEEGSGLRGNLEYATDLWEASSADRMTRLFLRILEGAAAAPERPLSLVAAADADERRHLEGWSRGRPAALGDETIHAVFSRIAAASPDAEALVWDGGRMTYAELDRRSRAVAARLRAAGVRADRPVAVAARRSPALVAALLGVLRAGAAYLPVDPRHPPARIAAQLADAGACVALAAPDAAARLPAAGLRLLPLETAEDAAWTGDAPDGGAGGLGAAYVMYTSGSTGAARGVVVPHRAVLRLVLAADYVELGPGHTLLQLAPAAFDASTIEIWGALLRGGRLALYPPELPSLEALGGFLVRHGVTTAWLTAGLFHQMVDLHPEGLGGLRQLLAGGDVLSVPHVRRLLRAHPGLRLVNGYGPTENTTFSCCHEVHPDDAERAAIPIGRPIAGSTARVLDAAMRPVPVDVPGELYVGGDGVARGYLGAPGLTAERYLPDPFSTAPGARLYRTGDRVRWRPEGILEFLGRIDQQVKIRGHRVEPAEIEAALHREPGVAAAVVQLREDAPGERRLVAYVVPAPVAPGEASGAGEDGSRQVARWEALFDMYRGSRGTDLGGEAFDVVGWNSSYTGSPIPATEMREWVDATVARILALGPGRVLELGVGTGLILFRVAPAAAAYLATDLSAQVLERLGERIGRAAGLPPVRLMQREAADLAGIPERGFDTAILNSVSQYFPSEAYLADVVERTMERLEDGGAFFVGDVRSRATVEAFRAAVELDAAGDAMPVPELRQRVRRIVEEEEELVVDPRFFEALAGRVPRIGRVDVRLKRGRVHNELTRHRYDVVVRAGVAAPLAPAPALDWEADRASVDGVRLALAARPGDPLAVLGIPDLRLEREIRVAALLASPDAPATVGEARRRLAGLAPAGVDPETLWALGESMGLRVEIRPGAAPGRMDALFVADGAAAGFPAAPVEEAAPAALTNDPAWAVRARELAPRLRERLREQLPEYMVPSALVVIPALPLTPNGKVDRRALPAPEPLRAAGEGERAEPRTETERLLAGVWAEVLRLERVYADESFFDLGGHSLLATQLVSRVREAFQVELPLQRIFEAPTVRRLAEAVDAARLDSMAGLLDDLDALSDDEVRALLEAEQDALGHPAG